jgi:hypothetical protein
MTGELDAIIDKRDMDFSVALYELMPDGRCLTLYLLPGARQLRC